MALWPAPRGRPTRPHAQDTTDGSEADARPHKEVQGNMDESDFTFDGGHRGCRAMSTKLGLGLFGAFFISISLAFEALEFLAYVAIVIGSACGVFFPTVSAFVCLFSATHGCWNPFPGSAGRRREVLFALSNQ